MSNIDFDAPLLAARAQAAALDRLVKIAKSDTGQSRRVANFLLAWWNASRDGGFDLTDLWNVDEAIANDMVVVFRMVSRTRAYPDSLGYEEDFRAIMTQWRGRKRRRKLAHDE